MSGRLTASWSDLGRTVYLCSLTITMRVTDKNLSHSNIEREDRCRARGPSSINCEYHNNRMSYQNPGITKFSCKLLRNHHKKDAGFYQNMRSVFSKR